MKKTTLNNILIGIIAILCVSIVFLIFCIAKRPRYIDTAETQTSVIAEDTELTTDSSDSAESEASSGGDSDEEASDEPLMQGKTSTRVNIRDNPSEDAKVLDTVDEGTTFDIVEILDNGWTHIIYDDGDAYISSSYVIVTSN